MGDNEHAQQDQLSEASGFPERWSPIITALDEFQSFFASRVPRFNIDPANDREWTREKYRAHRDETSYWRKSGVYLHFREDGQLLYVGMATNGFDRFWDSRPESARFTDIIPVDSHYHVFIPALELFLIRELHPPLNTLGKILPVDC